VHFAQNLEEGPRSMLVLSRHRDETIMIGDDIELTVVDIRGDKVRIGVKAPSNVPVHRKEVYDAIRLENEGAADFNHDDLKEVQPPKIAGM
jgi:carbon storage regulator